MPLSKTTRILIVLQLCFAFMMLAWYVCYPFMGELYHWRSRLFLVQNIVGDTQLLDYVGDNDKYEAKSQLEANQRLFSELPSRQQDDILEDLDHYRLKMKTSLQEKVLSSLDIFFSRLPPFKTAWLVFTFLACFALLFRIEGAHLTVWALPFLTLGYLLSSSGYPSGLPPDAQLFPKEEALFKEGQGFSKENLRQAWNHYLDREWGGEFYFNLERAKAYREHPSYRSAYLFKHKEPFFLLLLYFAWNLFFAYICFKHEMRSLCKNQSTPVFGQH